ncbi:DsbA family protein [Chthonobacter rhizosphaerae]|uniref:DsbA family protein n=1 Tax=Chthonobacter rhizosphaerae TaxID=2735553 RepID=UPI0015EE5369|nr:DsbA family protein [Chthonobacter rhizosphaerae]
MLSRLLRAAAFAGLMALVPPAAAAEPMTPEQKAAIEQIVKDYILANPEVIQEALISLEQKRQQAETEARASAVASMRDLIYTSKRQVVLGNPDAPITLVEFFDYNCGYCKRALDDTLALLEEKDVKIVLKEFPILGPGSVEAARVAVAVNLAMPEKYLDFHKALLTGRGQADEKRAFQVIDELGLDAAAIRAKMTDPEVANTLEEVYTVANRLGLSGTPTYVIGDEVVFGAVGVEDLKTKIMAMRECGKPVC